MSLVYFDTSAMLRLCLKQPGSQLAARLFGGASAVLTSRLTRAEGLCALANGQRLGLLDQNQANQATSRFEELWLAMYLVELSPVVCNLAANLASQYPLRGGDAIHAASAAQLGGGVIVASWDRSVQLAAAGQGLSVVPYLNA